MRWVLLVLIVLAEGISAESQIDAVSDLKKIVDADTNHHDDNLDHSREANGYASFEPAHASGPRRLAGFLSAAVRGVDNTTTPSTVVDEPDWSFSIPNMGTFYGGVVVWVFTTIVIFSIFFGFWISMVLTKFRNSSDAIAVHKPTDTAGATHARKGYSADYDDDDSEPTSEFWSRVKKAIIAPFTRAIAAKGGPDILPPTTAAIVPSAAALANLKHGEGNAVLGSAVPGATDGMAGFSLEPSATNFNSELLLPPVPLRTDIPITAPADSTPFVPLSRNLPTVAQLNDMSPQQLRDLLKGSMYRGKLTDEDIGKMVGADIRDLLRNAGAL